MIDDDVKLAGLLEKLKGVQWIALDTEADSLHAYPEKLCLIQLSTTEGDELIDPLARVELDPLFAALSEHELIMHGADYDLRLFRKHHAYVPGAIFDTMIASRLLGATQFGLTNLVTQYLGVTLDKGSQKADWGRRPLTERMEEYARNDTHYLKPLADKLKAELEAKGRLAWQQESCVRLIADCSQSRPPDPDLVWRIKGSHLLSPAGLAVLREIWHWRESEATAANKPPYFVLKHETMVEMSAAAGGGQSIEPLLPKKYSDRRREGLTRAVHRGVAVPPEQQPSQRKHEFRRMSFADKKRVAELEKKRNASATELGIDPTLIASRAMMIDLAVDWEANQAALMNWQRELLK